MEVDIVNILLVEDNPGDIELIKTGFEEARVVNQITVISDGQEALNFINKGEEIPDIILLDINLPKVNGFEILKKIRSTKASSNIPVVMLTSSDTTEDVEKSYSSRANSFITKPVDFEQFLKVIKSIECFWLTVVKLPRKAQ